MVFDAYARYYNLLYRDKSYSSEAEYVARHLRRHGPEAKHILELGCGTGGHAEHFARMGYFVEGIDLSEKMLERAELRKSRLPKDVAARMSFQQGDVRKFRAGKTYDAVVSLFHVMSYQLTDADQAAMLDTAAAHLPPEGAFIFDFWFGPAVLAQRPEMRVKRLEDKEIKVTRLAEPVLHSEDNIVDVNYTVFVEVKSTSEIHCVEEQHRMRYLFVPEIAELMRRGNWRALKTFAWMGDQEPDADHWAGCALALRT